MEIQSGKNETRSRSRSKRNNADVAGMGELIYTGLGNYPFFLIVA